MAVVKNLEDFNKSGMLTALPETIITAMVSPRALPSPKNIPEDIPFFAAGKTTLKIERALDSPSASEASKNLSEKYLIENSEMLIIVGKIMMIRTIIAVNKQSPVV